MRGAFSHQSKTIVLQFETSNCFATVWLWRKHTQHFWKNWGVGIFLWKLF